jgi:hypothetical protein
MARSYRTEVVYTTPSHVPDLPYENRRTVETGYDHYRCVFGSPWEQMTKDQQDVWSDWLARVHVQHVRRVEMVLSSDERNLIDDVYRAFDWDTYPDQIALDNIEAARAAS